MIDTSVNAGVHAKTGFALQRNTALHLLFTYYYNKFHSKKYFICLEHHDDFLFCFLDDKGKVSKVETYQSKKSSSEAWSINDEFDGVLEKILSVGINLLKDPIEKTKCYSHDLHFSSNASINLRATIKEVKKKTKTIQVSINESNSLVPFNELDNEIQDKIKERLKCEQDHQKELENLHFLYIDFSRTDKTQKETLLGELDTLFGDKITDRKAALKILIELFDKVENIFNQGHKPKLLDNSKRITSEEVNNALKIITSQSKALNYWRSKEEEISLALDIILRDKPLFKFNFVSAFDLFKSHKNVEHLNILKFVSNHYQESKARTEKELFEELYNKFTKENSTNLQDIEIKAIIYAAYFEISNKID